VENTLPLEGGTSGNIHNLRKLADDAFSGRNYSMAYYYYSKILEIDIGSWEAWFGEGLSAGFMAVPKNPIVAEMLSGFKNAQEHAESEQALSVFRDRMAENLEDILMHLTDNVHLRRSDDWREYTDWVLLVFDAIDDFHRLFAESELVLEYAIDFCHSVTDDLPKFLEMGLSISRFINEIASRKESYEDGLFKLLNPDEERGKDATYYEHERIFIGCMIAFIILFAFFILVTIFKDIARFSSPDLQGVGMKEAQENVIDDIEEGEQ
jgi:hypothetical protein